MTLQNLRNPSLSLLVVITINNHLDSSQENSKALEKKEESHYWNNSFLEIYRCWIFGPRNFLDCPRICRELYSPPEYDSNGWEEENTVRNNIQDFF
jgi:hypothetical protein